MAGLGVQLLSMRARGAIQAGSLPVFVLSKDVLSKDTDAILEGRPPLRCDGTPVVGPSAIRVLNASTASNSSASNSSRQQSPSGSPPTVLGGQDSHARWTNLKGSGQLW